MRNTVTEILMSAAALPTTVSLLLLPPAVRASRGKQRKSRIYDDNCESLLCDWMESRGCLNEAQVRAPTHLIQRVKLAV